MTGGSWKLFEANIPPGKDHKEDHLEKCPLGRGYGNFPGG